ncbi:MAG: hypothetical protein ABI726_10060 [bacterium]
MEYPPTERNDRRLGWIALAIAVAGALVALTLLLDLGPAADEELPPAEFLAQGDEICAQAQRSFEKLQRSEPTTAGEASALTSELLRISEDERDQVSDLRAPVALQQPLERYLDAREQGIEEIRAGLDAADDRDAFAYAKAQAAVADGQLRRRRLAREVGFEQCSRILGERDELAADARPPAEPTPEGAPPTIENPPTGTP